MLRKQTIEIMRLKKGKLLHSVHTQIVEPDRIHTDVTVPWRRLQQDYKRKQKDISTLYVVSIVGSNVHRKQSLTFEIAMTASQMRIAETIDAFYGDAGAKDGVSRSYKQAVEDLDAETIKALDGPYRYLNIFGGQPVGYGD